MSCTSSHACPTPIWNSFQLMLYCRLFVSVTYHSHTVGTTHCAPGSKENCILCCWMWITYLAVFHLEKWTRGSKIILRENLGGGAKGVYMAVLPLGGSGGMPPPENFWILDPLRSLLVHFSDHLWLSNDMMRWPYFTGADKVLMNNCWIMTSKTP